MGNRIITVGLAPAWDVCYRGDGVGWGRHAVVEARTARPAGKALNVSRALAWMGRSSIAAGFWGAEDYDQMRRAVREMGDFIAIQMTVVPERTRQNVTVVDTRHGREMHLRCVSELASERSLRKLKADLGPLVREGDICVFAGAMPEGGLLELAVGVVETCRRRGARIIVDTHGEALRRIVQEVKPRLISPNVEELGELVGAPVRDATESLTRAGERLLDCVENVLIHRGRKGAVLVTRDGIWTGRAVETGKVIETVGCGDYLLAGFLAGLGPHQAAWAEVHPTTETALATALKAATAHARGWTDDMTWAAARRRVKVGIDKL